METWLRFFYCWWLPYFSFQKGVYHRAKRLWELSTNQKERAEGKSRGVPGPEATRWPHLSLKQRRKKTGVDVHKRQGPHTRVWQRIRNQSAMFILCYRFGLSTPRIKNLGCRVTRWPSAMEEEFVRRRLLEQILLFAYTI